MTDESTCLEAPADQRSDAFTSGVAAFRRGEPLSNCPRLADLNIGRQWRIGWLHAKDHPLEQTS